MMQPNNLTISGVARSAGVGVETVRYYERRGLVARPGSNGGYRRYGSSHVARIRFIRRAQELGFTLEEVATLLSLEDGADRRSIRRVAAEKLAQIRRRIDDLRRMEQALAHVLHACEAHARAPRCPIIAAIAADAT